MAPHVSQTVGVLSETSRQEFFVSWLLAALSPLLLQGTVAMMILAHVCMRRPFTCVRLFVTLPRGPATSTQNCVKNLHHRGKIHLSTQQPQIPTVSKRINHLGTLVFGQFLWETPVISCISTKEL